MYLLFSKFTPIYSNLPTKVILHDNTKKIYPANYKTFMSAARDIYNVWAGIKLDEVALAVDNRPFTD